MEPAHFRERSSLEKGSTPWADFKGVIGESAPRSVKSSSIGEDDDARLLARIGYKQVCRGLEASD